MRILLAGDWRWSQYEAAFANGLSAHGHDVHRFEVGRFFSGPAARIERAIPLPGPGMLRLNRELLRTIESGRPDVFLGWRLTHVMPSTVAAMNRLGVATVSYNNDDPFGPSAHGHAPWHHRLLWRCYIRGLAHYQRNFFYREINVAEAHAVGARHAAVLLPYFVPTDDRPVALGAEDESRFRCDVVFAGHYEADGRAEALGALVAAGFNVKLFGSDWSRDVLSGPAERLWPVRPIVGDDYRKALCGARVCLAFLSKMNRDTYTRRCFEIPACGRVMLAERTPDLQRLFLEDQEACFFSSAAELVAKVAWLTADVAAAERIADAGRRRIWSDGHDVTSRAGQFIDALRISAPKDLLTPVSQIA